MDVRCVLIVGVLSGATATISNQQTITGTDTVAQLGANPIRKIVTLLQDMQKEIEAEGVKEKELYDKFMCFCQGGAGELEKSIADAAAAIETQTSAEKEQTAEKAGLEQDLIKHKSDRVGAGDDLEKATALRSKENAEYEADIADQKSNYAAISSAIPALETGMGGASLIQSNGPGLKTKIQKALAAAQTVSEMEKKDVMAFLENKQSSESPGSGQIVGILKNMKDEMEKSMESTESSEASAAAGYTDLKAAKEKEIELASEAIEAKTKRVGELAVAVVQAADAADDATKEKADAEKMLATLDTQCKTKVAEQAAADKLRAEEVSAISEAISILNDDDALDVFKKAVPSALIQSASSTRGARSFGFLQANAATPDRLRRATGIIDSAKQFHRSHKLALLSFTLHKDLRSMRSGGAVDFGAITKMIDEMVGVLEAEGKDDEKHKTWCVGELATTADSTESATAKAASLDAAISEATDEAATLGEDIKALTAGIAALDKDVATATEQRKAEHAEYLETIALTEAAIQLVGKAKNRLQKFYNPALYKAPPKVELSAEDKIISNLGGFVQLKSYGHLQKALSAVTSFLYQPKTEKSGGVMALMDMLVGDLKSSLQEAEHDEKTAQVDYTDLMADSQETRASDAKSITDKSSAKADLEAKVVGLKEQKALTVEELANLAGYTAEVHGSCDFILENFKLRADARTNEIESLKNAKAVLAGASYSF